MCDGLPDTIAIDGPAASGKTSLGKALARELGYRFLDTGLMYRAFTLAALRAHVPADDLEACSQLARRARLVLTDDEEARVLLDGEDVTGLLRDSDVEAAVSSYSLIPGVRSEMVRLQQEFAHRGQAVLAGRDIGTVVLPEAPVKFFLTASEEVRAKRRGVQAWEEWGRRQKDEDARRDIAGRDEVDASRTTSPMRSAEDAIEIDTSETELEDVVRFALEKVKCAG